MTDQRNLLLAIVITLAILFGFQYLYEIPRMQRVAEQQKQAEPATTGKKAAKTPAAKAPAAKAPTTAAPTAEVPTLPQAEEPAAAAHDRAAALAASPRIAIASPQLNGSIALAGGRIDDLALANYHETVDPKSPEIVLFSPLGAPKPYYAQFGWAAADGNVAVPVGTTRWTANGDRLAPGHPVTLTWDNGQGLRFSLRYDVDQNYMFTVTQQVTNGTDAPVTLAPYGLISRTGTPKTLNYYILHEGLIGVLNGTLDEIKYKAIKEDGQRLISSTGGWLGITDKYWLAALVPDQSASVKARFLHTLRDGIDKYQTDFQRQPVALAPGASLAVTSRLFAGAKVVRLLDRYEKSLGIPLFDRAVDFGYLWFLTRPIFFVLDYLYGIVGNFGIAILLLTVIIKGAFFPLANKSYRSMSKMKKLQPQMQKMREQFGDDKQRLHQEMMKLYKTEKVNPASGCLPMVVQIPVFFSLYKVLFVTIEMRHAPFFGWIQDLSSPDPTSVFNLFGILPFTPPSFLAIGIWPLIMGITMFLQQKLNPQPMDKMQARLFQYGMPIFFTYLLARFPAGLVIYWTWNNILSIAQQWLIMRRMATSGD